MSLESRAAAFAGWSHGNIDQRRKYTAEPYITHPEAVAMIVRSVPHTEAMLAAAWLHDVVEDTPATLDDITFRFGEEVASLVYWLTDTSQPGDGNRAKRKAIDRAHSAAAPPAAQTIKLADLIDNTASITAFDPDFAKVYLKEKQALLEVMNKGDPGLYERARNIVGRGKNDT